MITIVETLQFIKESEKLLTEFEKDKLFQYIASQPGKGALITGTGGVRKLRFATKVKGKRSGVRVIYYYFNDNNPVFLFYIYGKNQKIDLSEDDKKMLYDVVQKMKKKMRGSIKND
ncbi:MAG: type II toxin-antitoxin system RelE/ParE family toxin [Thermodesulfobacteriota bacterium]